MLNDKKVLSVLPKIHGNNHDNKTVADFCKKFHNNKDLDLVTPA